MSKAQQILHVFELRFRLSVVGVFLFVFIHKIDLKVGILEQVKIELCSLLVSWHQPLLLGYGKFVYEALGYFLDIFSEVKNELNVGRLPNKLFSPIFSHFADLLIKLLFFLFCIFFGTFISDRLFRSFRRTVSLYFLLNESTKGQARNFRLRCVGLWK